MISVLILKVPTFYSFHLYLALESYWNDNIGTIESLIEMCMIDRTIAFFL